MDSNTFHKISYGLYIVSSKNGNRYNGQIANTVFQVTSEPPTMAVSINKENLTHEFIRESGVFTASILSRETPMALIGQFGFKSGREIEKYKDINYKVGLTGAPVVIDHAVGYLESEVIKSLDAGTHTVFIGRLIEAEVLRDEEPMTYAYYHEIKRGKAPKTGPTHIGGENKMATEKAHKYECTVCGYIYDPDIGDPDSDIMPGTSFEELPDDWACPICGADKESFRRVES